MNKPNQLNAIQSRVSQEQIHALSPAELNQRMNEATAALCSGHHASDPVAKQDLMNLRTAIMSRLIELETGDAAAASQDVAALGGQVDDDAASLAAVREQAQAIADIDPEHSQRLLDAVAESEQTMQDTNAGVAAFNRRMDRNQSLQRHHSGIAVQSDIDALREKAGQETNPILQVALRNRAEADQVALNNYEQQVRGDDSE